MNNQISTVPHSLGQLELATFDDGLDPPKSFVCFCGTKKGYKLWLAEMKQRKPRGTKGRRYT